MTWTRTFLLGVGVGAVLGGGAVGLRQSGSPRETGKGSLIETGPNAPNGAAADGERTKGDATAPADGADAADLARRVAQADEQFQKKELERREQVRTLLVSLAEARAEADELRARVERAEWASASDPAPAGRPAAFAATVLDYNSDLNLAVLNAGSASGVRRGLVYQILRDGTWVARVRALDVRDRITGARVEESRPGTVPRAGDRAVLGENPR